MIVSDPHTSASVIATTRIKDLQASSFKIKLQRPNYLAQTRQALQSTIHYLVIESGEWTLEDGMKISAGHFASNKLSSQGWNRVHMNGFTETPTVLTQIQTSNGGNWVISRTRRQNVQSFEVTMQEEESLNSGHHMRETLGWVAVSQGIAMTNSASMEARTTDRLYRHRVAPVQLQTDASNATLLVKIASSFGRDTALARVSDQLSDRFNVQVAEEQSRDQELRHTREAISYLVFGDRSGRLHIEEDAEPETGTDRSFGEFGQITINDQWQTVMLQKQYESPIVVVSDPKAQNGLAMSVRLRNVNTQSFEVKLQGSAGHLDHLSPENISFMVIEEGEWVSENGARISAGQVSSNKLSRQGWESVRFDQRSQSMVAFTQVQSTAEEGWLVTRVKNQSRRGFDFTMQEQEIDQRRGTHDTETIGWIVIDEGDHQLDHSRLLSTTTSSAISHRVTQVQFTQAFESTPLMIAKMGSTRGGDSSNVSIEEANASGFNVRIAEENSRDQETRHIRESVSIIALSDRSGRLLAQ